MRLARYVGQRLVAVLPVLLGLVVITFFLARVVPADPVAVIAGERATRQQIEELRKRYGFDRPLVVQLAIYLRQLATGDLGTSIYSGRDVRDDIIERLPATVELAGCAMAVAIVLGIPLGVASALRRNSLLDHVLRAATTAGLAIAAFWLGILLQLLFSMYFNVAPLGRRLGGIAPPTVTGLYLIDTLLGRDLAAFGDALRHLFLPTLTLAYPALATITRFTRAGVLDILQRDHVIYARCMGLPRVLIVWKYVLRNALTSTVTQIGLLTGSLLAGAVVVERVYDWPGLGLYAVESILLSDYKPILAVTLWAGLVYTLVNLAVDVVQAALDPRVVER